MTVSNNGDDTVSGMSVADNYDTDFLQFVSAVPAPDFDATPDDGTLDWTNLEHAPPDGTPTTWEPGSQRNDHGDIPSQHHRRNH